MTDPMVGRIIGERYRLESCIGSGGMGQVYRARHLLIDREVAIKLLRLDRRSQQHSRAWFVREARAVNRVNHPNIVDIYDLGETEDGLVYLVMELLRGAPLTQRIDDGPIMVGSAVNIIEQVARALARAHDLGVIHRDLKPDNVFLLSGAGRPETVKLIDFGLARLITEGRITVQGAVFGTPGYQSPEQARGEDAGPQSDLYALGVILYEMVTGRPPFDADNPVALLEMHASEPPPPPSRYQPHLDPAVEEVILKLMAKGLDERYHDAYHLLEDCRAVMSRVLPDAPAEKHPDGGRPRSQPAGEVHSNVTAWAMRAAVFGRMAATSYPGGGSPELVTHRIDMLWRLVAELSRIEGELQVTQNWDDNLRQRAREFVDQVSRQIEDLSKERSSLHREVIKGRGHLDRHRHAHDEARRELAHIRSAAQRAESNGAHDQLWAMLQAAGAAAAREQVHLDAVTLVEQKIDKWQRTMKRVESQAQALRRQVERHSEQVEQDLELGRPRFSALLEQRRRAVDGLTDAASVLQDHFRLRPGCAGLLEELAAIPGTGEEARTMQGGGPR